MACRSLLSLALAVSLLASSVSASDLGNAPGVDPDSILYYSPSAFGNVAFGVLYAIACAGLYINLYKKRDWWGLCLPIGATFQCIGFFIRLPLRSNSGSLMLYIAQNFCIVLAPACYFAFSYILFGRFAYNLQHDTTIPKRKESVTLLNPLLFGRVFILSDVATFLIQAGGGGMQVSQDLAKMGAKIFLAGIILQGLSYIIFLGLCFYAHVVVSPRGAYKHPLHGKIQKLFWVLYFASIWIIVRSVYRTIELAQGFRGYLITNEIYFFLLDSLPLLLCLLTWVIFWPSKIVPLQRSESGFQSQSFDLGSGKYEVTNTLDA
ncbi:unnamed protein product [Tilletia controversa]|uniref:RTA1-domain-containing protein n=3 Tax=Tilletia TaxID=13289 RepID=A0A8X7SWP8_9BASI|nr:hypothetical protein CF336_g1397 [Tilletia laevis]KAE8202308.1 hypothetical protein CF328_g2289 [Tilletia controversa]KAE8264302.1 hypothetical protein A4X03_0g1046 [Tilletia caries]KAE8206638.1 hypothetical protein CF335_g1733 [Tilletia laevis]KAE8247730.1 hypothetical protein A4X06_0g4233 [Tilletia controversa]